MPMKLSTTDPSTPKKHHQRTLSAADLTSPLTSAVSTTLASPAAAVRSFFLASPTQQQLLQAEKQKELGTGSIQNSCYNYFYYNQAEENNSNHGGGSSSHHGNINNNNHSSSNGSNIQDMEQRIQNVRVPLQECRRVLEDEEQFRKLQQRLRDASCQTNGALKQCWTDLLRERTDDAKRLATKKEAQQRAQDQALASQLDQVNLENEISSSAAAAPVTPKTSSSSSSPKGVMDFSKSSSTEATTMVPKKPSSSKTSVTASASAAAAMVNAVKAPPFGMEEDSDSSSSSSSDSSNQRKSVTFQ